MRGYERIKKTCEREVKNAVKRYEKNIANNGKKKLRWFIHISTLKKSLRTPFGH